MRGCARSVGSAHAHRPRLICGSAPGASAFRRRASEVPDKMRAKWRKKRMRRLKRKRRKMRQRSR